jgi:hypothetical protein
MPTIYKTIEVEVDADLKDFESEELVDELKRRGVDSGMPGDLPQQREAMLRALWDHDEKRVIELLKTYLCDVLGRAAI